MEQARLYITEYFDVLINALDINREKLMLDAAELALNYAEIDKQYALRDMCIERAKMRGNVNDLNERNIVQYFSLREHHVAYVTQDNMVHRLDLTPGSQRFEIYNNAKVTLVLQLVDGRTIIGDSEKKLSLKNWFKNRPEELELGRQVDSGVCIDPDNIIIYERNQPDYYLIETKNYTDKERQTSSRDGDASIMDLIALPPREIAWAWSCDGSNHVEQTAWQDDRRIDLQVAFVDRVVRWHDGKIIYVGNSRNEIMITMGARRFSVDHYSVRTEPCRWAIEIEHNILAIGFLYEIVFVDVVRQEIADIKPIGLKKVEKYFDGIIGLTNDGTLRTYTLPNMDEGAVLAKNVKLFSCTPIPT